MKLTNRALHNTEQWKKAGVELPKFDRDRMCETTRRRSNWLHFGVENEFCIFPAVYQQLLLEKGLSETGIIVVDSEAVIHSVFRRHDNLFLLVTLLADGTKRKQVVGSIAESVCLHENRRYLQKLFCKPDLQIASFTITEKEYRYTDIDGRYLPEIEHDMMAGPGFCVSFLGQIAALLYLRYQAGRLPITMLSLDNCTHNGDRLKDAIVVIAEAWRKNRIVEEGFLYYVADGADVSYPWSMLDKIIPCPSREIQEELNGLGLEEVDIYNTESGLQIAPFKNVERSEYIVIEDAFPNGRPPLEKVGVLLTDRKTVEKVERMKLSTCLNPPHTALAIFGCLLGYKKISDEMQNVDLLRMVECLGYQEGLPVVVDPGVLSPGAFFQDVIRERFPNRYIPDTPQRIICDTSQKLSMRFGETIKAYMRHPNRDVEQLRIIPMILAAWIRYLMGVDDQGNEMEPMPDPAVLVLSERVRETRLDNPQRVHEALQPILCNADIFGVDLYTSGIGHRVEEIFMEMAAGPGAVQKTLHKIVWENGALSRTDPETSPDAFAR